MTSITRPVLERQYWDAKERGALRRSSNAGVLKMTGGDSLDLLHRLTTQDLHALASGQGQTTVLTSDKGRIIDLLDVLAFDDHLLLLTSPGNQSAVVKWLSKYTIIEDSETVDVTTAWDVLLFFGARAAKLAEELIGDSVTTLPPRHHLPIALGAAEGTLQRTRSPVGEGFHLIVPCQEASQAWDALTAAGRALGIGEVAPEAYEALRIEAGLPAHAAELDERYNPLEAGLMQHISFDKGCYIGQEVIARLDTYDKVQRRLMGLLPSGETLIPPGVNLIANGKDAGVVTSSAYSLGIGGGICLAMVRRAHAEAGRPLLALVDGVERVVEMTDLPFHVPPSSNPSPITRQVE